MRKSAGFRLTSLAPCRDYSTVCDQIVTTRRGRIPPKPTPNDLVDRLKWAIDCIGLRVRYGDLGLIDAVFYWGVIRSDFIQAIADIRTIAANPVSQEDALALKNACDEAAIHFNLPVHSIHAMVRDGRIPRLREPDFIPIASADLRRDESVEITIPSMYTRGTDIVEMFRSYVPRGAMPADSEFRVESRLSHSDAGNAIVIDVSLPWPSLNWLARQIDLVIEARPQWLAKLPDFQDNATKPHDETTIASWCIGWLVHHGADFMTASEIAGSIVNRVPLKSAAFNETRLGIVARVPEAYDTLYQRPRRKNRET